MYLLLSIILSGILGLVLFLLGPIIGGIVGFAIVAGCIFRGLYLLNEIYKTNSTISPKKDKVQEAYDKYIMERDKDSY